ncbi:hypothetical protein [Paenochrobactrum pullorum]|uniref:hypothetical protein n=1 Tax=Paenochrobactrum pullorum TaxID=1324351 RepID=UPI0035BC8D13
MTNKIMIEPAVALNELTIDHAYSRDRRLFLAHELNLTQTRLNECEGELVSAKEEIARLNEVIQQMQGVEIPTIDTTEIE